MTNKDLDDMQEDPRRSDRLKRVKDDIDHWEPRDMPPDYKPDRNDPRIPTKRKRQRRGPAI